MSHLGQVEFLFRESAELKQRTVAQWGGVMVTVAEVLTHAIDGGNTILFCGNGGSAADSQHLAAELLVRLRPMVNRRPFPALALTLDTSTLTACANDYGFENCYSRMVEALGREGGVLVAISTTGMSPNIVQALEIAQIRGLTTVGLLGGRGGLALLHCDHFIIVPSTVTGRIQETHITIGHAILELVEDMVLDEAA